MNKESLKKIYIPFIYTTIFCFYYILFLNQGLRPHGPLGYFNSDLPFHALYSSQPYLHKNWLSLLAIDCEPLLHMLTATIACIIHFISDNTEKMDLINAMAFILSLAKLTQFILIKKIINERTNLNTSESIILTIIINLCASLYLPIINLNVYFPMMSPNILHNPTIIALSPLAITFFYWYLKCYIYNPEYPPNYRTTFLFSLLLFLATLIKPSFTNVILLVIAIYYLFHFKRFFSKYFVHDLLIFVPSSLVLIYQIYLIAKTGYGGILEFAPYKVIGHYTKHPILSLLQAIEFPLLITGVYLFRREKTNFDYMGFAWLFCILSYLIFALGNLAGPAYLFANLAWSYGISLTLLYLFSIITYVKIISDNNYISIKQCQPTHENINDSSKLMKFIVLLCTVNLSLIILSGINLYIRMFMGSNYL